MAIGRKAVLSVRVFSTLESIWLRTMDMGTLKRLFGRRVRSLRKLRDLTQEELAEATSLSAEYVSKVERGLTSPSFEVIAKLAEALQVDPSMLFDFSELHGSRHGNK